MPDVMNEVRDDGLRIERAFLLFAADLSLRRPGFALLWCDPEVRSVKLLRTWHLESNSRTKVGAVLSLTYAELMVACKLADVLVREQGFSRFPRETQALYKVFGVADLAGWQSDEKLYHEIAPLSMKKIIAGRGKATKADVAAALEQYIGRHEYATDDESDAAAVGIAWLIQNGYIRVCATITDRKLSRRRPKIARSRG